MKLLVVIAAAAAHLSSLWSLLWSFVLVLLLLIMLLLCTLLSLWLLLLLLLVLFDSPLNSLALRPSDLTKVFCCQFHSNVAGYCMGLLRISPIVGAGCVRPAAPIDCAYGFLKGTI